MLPIRRIARCQPRMRPFRRADRREASHKLPGEGGEGGFLAIFPGGAPEIPGNSRWRFMLGVHTPGPRRESSCAAASHTRNVSSFRPTLDRANLFAPCPGDVRGISPHAEMPLRRKACRGRPAEHRWWGHPLATMSIDHGSHLRCFSLVSSPRRCPDSSTKLS